VQQVEFPDAHALDGFSAGALAEVKRVLGLRTKLNDRATLAAAISRFIGTEAHHALLVDHLSDAEWSVLAGPLLESGEAELASVAAALSAATGGEGGASTLKLLSLCALLPDPDRRRSGFSLRPDEFPYVRRYVTCAPPSFVRDWAEVEALPLDPPRPMDPPPAAVRPMGLVAVQRAIYLLLTELARKPLRHRLDGELYDADVKRLLKLWGEARQESSATAAGERPLFWFALAILMGAQLLQDTAGEWRPALDALGLLTAPAAHQADTLLAGWAPSRYNEIVTIPTLVVGYAERQQRPFFSPVGHDPVAYARVAGARAYVCDTLRRVIAQDPNAWYRASDFAAFAFRQHPEMLLPRKDAGTVTSPLFESRPVPKTPYTGIHRSTAVAGPDGTLSLALNMEDDWIEVEGAFVQQVLREPLSWLGVVETAEDERGECCFRLTALGQHLFAGGPVPKDEPSQPTASLAVQPNFEIIVPDALSCFALLGELEQFAERLTVDRAATYRLTQNALARALDGLWTLERVGEVLQSASRAPIPQNVRFTLQEWAAVHGRLTLHPRTGVLGADSAEELDAWSRDPRLAPLLGQRLGPRHVLVSSAASEGLLRTLTSRGRPPIVVDYAGSPVKALRFKSADVVEVRAGADPYVRYRMSAIAEEASSGAREGTYRLTEPSVRRGVAMGWKGAEIVDFLATSAAKAVPAELRIRVLGWGRSVAPALFEPVIAVKLGRSAVTWEDLARIAGIAERLAHVISPQLALVRPAELDALQEALKSCGVAIEPGLALDEPAQDGPVDEVDLLKGMLLRFNDHPEGVVDAMRRARILGKFERARERRYYY